MIFFKHKKLYGAIFTINNKISARLSLKPTNILKTKQSTKVSIKT